MQLRDRPSPNQLSVYKRGPELGRSAEMWSPYEVHTSQYHHNCDASARWSNGYHISPRSGRVADANSNCQLSAASPGGKCSKASTEVVFTTMCRRSIWVGEMRVRFRRFSPIPRLIFPTRLHLEHVFWRFGPLQPQLASVCLPPRFFLVVNAFLAPCISTSSSTRVA